MKANPHAYRCGPAVRACANGPQPPTFLDLPYKDKRRCGDFHFKCMHAFMGHG